MHRHTAIKIYPKQQTARQAIRGALVCFAASLFFFYEFFQLNMFNAINPSLMREFHINAAQIGVISAYYFFANILFQFPAGIILDRVNTRKMIIMAMSVSILCTLGFAHAQSVQLIQLCRFFTGIAACFCFLSCLRLASRWFPPKRLALVIGLIVTIAMMGGTVAQTPMTWLTDVFGWRYALWVDAMGGFAILVFIFCVVRDYPPESQDIFLHHRRALADIGFWQALRKTIMNGQNWLAGLYTSLMNLPIFLLGAIWGSLYLVQIHHLPRISASHITTMIFIGTILGSPIIGMFSDFINRRKMPMMICAIISLLIMIPIIYLPHITSSSGMILFFMLGFFTSGQVISYALITESNEPWLTATATGIASTLIMAGGTLQPLFGWLLEWRWDKQMVNGVPQFSWSDFQLALAIIPIAFLLSTLLTFLIRDSHPDRGPGRRSWG